ncbi:MAG: tetratricopeptide repeat protein [Alphaproteobacteria bacterium]
MKWTKKKKCDECRKDKDCSECKKYQDKAFELEVDEELQQEKLAEWWKKYSWLVYSGVAAVLLTTAGVEWYRSHQMKVRLTESDSFEKASLLAHEGKNEEAEAAFKQLATSGKTGYRMLALMNLANLQMNAGQTEEGLKTLKTILESTPPKDPLHLTSSLSYVAYQMESAPSEELLKVLESALENEAFQGLATELAVPLLKSQGKTVEAEALLQKALQSEAVSAGSKARLNALRGE